MFLIWFHRIKNAIKIRRHLKGGGRYFPALKDATGATQRRHVVANGLVYKDHCNNNKK